MLSYNIQVGISGTQPHHHLTKIWKHLVPHGQRFDTLDRIAELLVDFDVVALQEVDAGSLRSSFINLTEYLAERAHFPFWKHQCNRNIGKLARHSNGILSRYRPSEIVEHKLPGIIPGRGALQVRFGHTQEPLIIMLIHLALSRRVRLKQLEYISDVVNEYEHVVLMGDMNCEPGSQEMELLHRRTHLCEQAPISGTYPSWRPARQIDHIMVTPGLEVTKYQVIHHSHSDHLPIAMEIALPDGIHIAG